MPIIVPRATLSFLFMVAALIACDTGGSTPSARSGLPTSSTNPVKRCAVPNANCPGVTFVEADLAGADVSGADFSRGFIAGTDLSEADLSGADLSNTRFEEVDLSGADLSGANLSGAGLKLVDLSGADLTDADLTDVRMFDSDFSDARLVRTKLAGIDLQLDGVDFAGAHLEDNELGRGSYITFAAGLTAASLASAMGVAVDGDLTQALIDRGVTFRDVYSLRDAFEGACGGSPVGGTRTPPPDAAYHPTVVVLVPPDPEDGFNPGEFKTPADWYPAAVPLAEYLACVATSPVELERCSYASPTPGGGGAVLIRYRQDVTVSMVEASTASVIAEKAFAGSTPEPCAEDIGVTPGASQVSSSGDWPGEAVLAFVAPFAGQAPPGIPER